MIQMLSRRSFLSGLIAAPVVVKYASLMPVRGIIMPTSQVIFDDLIPSELLGGLEDWYSKRFSVAFFNQVVNGSPDFNGASGGLLMRPA